MNEEGGKIKCNGALTKFLYNAIRHAHLWGMSGNFSLASLPDGKQSLVQFISQRFRKMNNEKVVMSE